MGPGELDERRIPVLTGRAWCFADRLSAADILPGPDASGGQLFRTIDPSLAARLAPGDVIVGGQLLGGGPGGGMAARALAGKGVIAVVAANVADGFEEPALAAGLLPLEVHAPAIFHTGQRLRINCEGGTIANLSSGDRQPLRNLTDELLVRLRDLVGR